MRTLSMKLTAISPAASAAWERMPRIVSDGSAAAALEQQQAGADREAHARSSPVVGPDAQHQTEGDAGQPRHATGCRREINHAPPHDEATQRAGGQGNAEAGEDGAQNESKSKLIMREWSSARRHLWAS